MIIDRESSAIQSGGLRDDILNLAADLTRSFGQIRLSLHWYSGDTETENFKLKDAGATSLPKFLEDPSSFKEETTQLIKKANKSEQATPRKPSD